MNNHDWLAQQFQENRTHLHAVALRMLGSASEADDAVQETWLRLSRSDSDSIENLGGWLTTVVARVCLDTLRARKTHQEEPIEDFADDAMLGSDTLDPEHEALLANSVGLAMLVVLEKLSPTERVAFVLHDVFDLPFEQIANIVGCSPIAARQLASRARRRVRETTASSKTDTARQQQIVDAFFAASRNGDLSALLSLLDPDVILQADEAAAQMGAPGEVRGVTAVTNFFAGRSRDAKLALVDGKVGAVWAPGGKLRVLFEFSIIQDKIAAIHLIGDPERLQQSDVEFLDK